MLGVSYSGVRSHNRHCNYRDVRYQLLRCAHSLQTISALSLFFDGDITRKRTAQTGHPPLHLIWANGFCYGSSPSLIRISVGFGPSDNRMM